MRGRTVVGGARALAATCVLLAASVLGGCATDRMEPLDGAAGYPQGLRLFSAPPGRADCSRIDLAGLRKVAGADQPEPRALLQQSKSDHSLKWASCAGLAPVDPASASPSASPDPADAAAGGDTAGASPSPSGNADLANRTIVWEVAWATSQQATLPAVRSNPKAGDRDYHTLTRTTTIGDARADVMLAVHADDHQTQIWVTVFDPRTGRDAAECGIGGVPGDQADAAIAWCGRAIVGQLLRVPLPLPTGN